MTLGSTEVGSADVAASHGAGLHELRKGDEEDVLPTPSGHSTCSSREALPIPVGRS